MHRIILKLPFLTIYTWGVMAALGFGVAILYFITSTKKYNLPRYLMLNLVVGIVIFSIVGARLFYISAHLNYYYLHPDKTYRLWEGGEVFYGGLFFALTFSIFYIKTHNLSLGKIADCAAPGIAFGFSIGRIGCFLNGCCYGIPFSFGLSSFNLFTMGLVLHLFKKEGIAKYKLLPLFLILYSVHRFFIEFFRGDTYPIFFNLTLFQIVSIILAVFSLIWWRIATDLP